MESSGTVISLPGAAAPQIPTNNFLEKSSQLPSKGDEVKSAKAEMNQVREENTRLKKLLQEIGSEYKSLKMRVNNNTQNEDSQEAEEHELVSLCLGRSPNEFKKEEHVEFSRKTRGEQDMDLKLGRGYDHDESKFGSGRSRVDSSPYRSSSESKEEDSRGQTWSPSKVLKVKRIGDEDDVSQASVKRARVSVRAKCSTPTMNDGCQWRKYGQKIAKNNPCPRAYYRCTVAPSCPVRKQVQRCAEDMSILITTYEGTHNHPLPASATAMASTTSAAASMLLSGSSSSTQGLGPTASANMTNTPFYLHNSGSPPFPTVTLDLTTTLSTSSSQYNMVSTAFASTPRFPTTFFGFSASDSNVFPAVFGTAPFCNKSQDIGSFQTRRPFQEHISQPEYQKNYQVPSQQVLTETLTRAITSDPSFRSIIAAAISTVVAGGSPAQAQSKVEIVGRNLTRDDQETSAV